MQPAGYAEPPLDAPLAHHLEVDLLPDGPQHVPGQPRDLQLAAPRPEEDLDGRRRDGHAAPRRVQVAEEAQQLVAVELADGGLRALDPGELRPGVGGQQLAVVHHAADALLASRAVGPLERRLEAAAPLQDRVGRDRFDSRLASWVPLPPVLGAFECLPLERGTVVRGGQRDRRQPADGPERRDRVEALLLGLR